MGMTHLDRYVTGHVRPVLTFSRISVMFGPSTPGQVMRDASSLPLLPAIAGWKTVLWVSTVPLSSSCRWTTHHHCIVPSFGPGRILIPLGHVVCDGRPLELVVRMVHVIIPIEPDNSLRRHIVLHARELVRGGQAATAQVLRHEGEVPVPVVGADPRREDAAAVLDQAGGDGVPRVGVVVEVGAGGARALAPDDDAGGVAAEGGDVVAHPLDGQPLVEEAHVEVCALLRLVDGVGEAEDVGAVAVSGVRMEAVRLSGGMRNGLGLVHT